MRYVILKKINNVWYATRNRYTAKELEIIVDKHYNDVVDYVNRMGLIIVDEVEHINFGYINIYCEED